MSEESFFNACTGVRSEIERMREPVIVSHYDADGLASAGVSARALRKMGKKFRSIVFRKLGEQELACLKGEREIIFTDFGAGSIDLVAELKAHKVVIDHHQGAENNSVLQANPCAHGFDGGREVSAAGVAFFVFGFPELADLALVGAVGDMQAHSQFGLTGLNRKIIKAGEECGAVKASKGLKLFGRNFRPLAPFISYSTEPFLPFLTGSDDACKRFVESLGISLQENEKWRNYLDLSESEKKQLATALIVHAYSLAGEFSARELVGEVYSLTNQPEGTELCDAQEFSTLLNACGRNDKPELGLNVCLGEPNALHEAKQLLQTHRNNLREGVKFAQAHVEDFHHYHFLDAREAIADGIIGVIAGMLYSTIDRSKPVVAFSLDSEKSIKISTRATTRLVKNGLNLGAMLRTACAGLGWGGGHNIAAGATINASSSNEFLLAAARELKKQKTIQAS
ncbi:DHH family phosphoesterase [Candidatus Micrarchaeota archaeon]|nr:DHH family phosphoesterase [Candidatus Micrarchaeota archaeon]